MQLRKANARLFCDRNDNNTDALLKNIVFDRKR
jgi:hypothetical protein